MARVMQIPQTFSPKFRAGSTNRCGFSKLTCSRDAPSPVFVVQIGEQSARPTRVIRFRNKVEGEIEPVPDPIERKRLKKKMLDRWENEGGRICVEPAGANDPKPTSEPKGKSKQRATSRGNAKAGGLAPSAKRRKPNRE